MYQFTREEMQKIHDASMELLKETGICFNEPVALEILRQHGKRVDWNPENGVAIGEDNLVFVPGYGAPFVVTAEGDQRQGSTST